MSSKGYNSAKRTTTCYEFVSTGPKGTITKRIEFTPLNKRGYYNVGFGDVMEDGMVNDIVYSGNQDIVKVMVTVIEVMHDFLKAKPTAKLAFTGSTDDRTRFYSTILKRYFKTISSEFDVSCLVEDEKKNNTEVEFNPNENDKYLAFFVKNKM